MRRLAFRFSSFFALVLAGSLAGCGGTELGVHPDAGRDLTGLGNGDVGRDESPASPDGDSLETDRGFTLPDGGSLDLPSMGDGPDASDDGASLAIDAAVDANALDARGAPEGGSGGTDVRGTGGAPGALDAGHDSDEGGLDGAASSASLGSGGATTSGGNSGAGGLVLGTGGNQGTGGTIVGPAGTGGTDTGSGGATGTGGATAASGSGGTPGVGGAGGTTASGGAAGASDTGGAAGSSQAGAGAAGTSVLDSSVDAEDDSTSAERDGGDDVSLPTDDAGVDSADLVSSATDAAATCTGPIEVLSFATSDGGIGTAPTTLALGTDFTIEAWIYPTVAAATGLIFTKWADSVEDKTLYVVDGQVGLRVWRGADYVLLTSATALAAGAWHHVACSVGGGSARLYIDGVLDHEAALAPAASADAISPIWIGSTFRDGGQAPGLPGYITDLRVSTGARYTADFSPALLLSPDADTLALWHIDDGGTSTVVHDSGPQSLDGTVVGAAAWLPGPARCSALAGGG